jgi:predicted acylesterase/phospholipase RssA
MQHEPLSVALGGGGAFGIAFHLGLAHGLDSQGVRLASHPMLGVSAGAWAAAALATATPLAAVVDSWHGLSRHRGPVRLHEATQGLFGRARAAHVEGVALRLPAGRRVRLSGEDNTLAEVVAAASSAPRLSAPMTVNGTRLYDAGLLHNTCADLAAPAAGLLIVAPLAAGVLGGSGLLWEHRLRREALRWRLRHHRPVMVVRPSEAAFATGARTWGELMSGRNMLPVYELGLAQGAELAPRLHRHFETARAAA